MGQNSILPSLPQGQGILETGDQAEGAGETVSEEPVVIGSYLHEPLMLNIFSNRVGQVGTVEDAADAGVVPESVWFLLWNRYYQNHSGHQLRR